MYEYQWYTSVLKLPSTSFLTVVSKKFTSIYDISWVYLISGTALFSWLMILRSDSMSLAQMKKMSSINRFQKIMSSTQDVSYTNLFSMLPIYTLAKFGATLVPMAVPLT